MTIVQNRRDFIGIAAGVALATGAAGALAQGVPKTEYAIEKLPFDQAKIKGLSEKLLLSHYENNYSGAVKRLNAISAQLASLDMANAPVFVVNGLKREELIAANSMIIHELNFDVLVPWAATADEPFFAMTDRADTRRRIDAILERLRAEGADR